MLETPKAKPADPFAPATVIERETGIPRVKVPGLAAAGLIRSRLLPGARRTTYSLSDAQEIAKVSTTQRPE
jgi:hypothetical protein